MWHKSLVTLSPRVSNTVCSSTAVRINFSCVNLRGRKIPLLARASFHSSSLCSLRSLRFNSIPMPRKLSSIAPEWWDYTTLDADIIEAAARLTPDAMIKLSRPGFRVVFYDTLEDFYLAEALEYVTAWKQSTTDNPVGICGPIGPTEQLPLVARL